VRNKSANKHDSTGDDPEYPNIFGGVEPEDIFIKEFPTAREPLIFRGEVEIDGSTLHLKDIGIFPAQSRRASASISEFRGIFDQLAEQARYEQVQ